MDETGEDLRALHDAVLERIERRRLDVSRWAVAIPAYGIVPGEAAFVALLAALLRSFGVSVVVHGMGGPAGGVSAERVLRELGIAPSGSLVHAQETLDRDGVAFVPVKLLSPSLATMLSFGDRPGVANAAHLVAQVLDPTNQGALRLVAGFESSSPGLESLAPRLDGEFVFLLWPAGRSALNLHTRPRIERLRHGEVEVLFECDVREMHGGSTPAFAEPGAVARWIAEVVSGTAPVPAPMANILAACLYALGYVPGLHEAKAVAALGPGRAAMR